jgi:hypothetical protein
MLMEAGSFESIADQQSDQRIEEQQIGFEPPNFIGYESPLAAFAIEELPASPFNLRGRRRIGAGVDILSDDPVADPPVADEIAAVLGTVVGGHGSGSRKRRNSGRTARRNRYKRHGARSIRAVDQRAGRARGRMNCRRWIGNCKIEAEIREQSVPRRSLGTLCGLSTGGST